MTIDIDERKVARNEAGLWLSWTLATAAGMALGFLPAALVAANLELGLVRVLVPLVAGFLVGLFQWLVVRGYVTRSADWILAGGAGWALGFALGLFLIQSLATSFLGTVVAYILFGVILALMQWPVLRREIPHVAPWILANILGWGLGFYLSPVVLDALADPAALSPAASSLGIALIAGLVAGAITGLAFIWIVRQPER